MSAPKRQLTWSSGALSIGVGLVSWVSIYGGLRGPERAASAHNLALSLTLTLGILAATWWRQAAVLGDSLLNQSLPDTSVAHDSSRLNGSAATATALGLIASAFLSTTWDSRGAWACIIGFLLTIAIYGSDLTEATRISIRYQFLRKSIVSVVLIMMAFAVYASNRTAG